MCEIWDMSDGEYVRAEIEREIPESAGFIDELERESVELAQDLGVESHGVGLYSLLSDGLVWPVLIPALRSSSPEGFATVQRCGVLIEKFVTSSRSEVRQAAGIRIVEVLAGGDIPWSRFSHLFGVETQEMVRARRGLP